MTKILFVDDDLSFAAGIVILLQKSGFYVITANDGMSAIEAAKNQTFDLVITDMVMAKGHGVEVIMNIRANYPATKLIAISGGGWDSPESHLESARLFGADGFLTKPFSVADLYLEIERVLRL